MSRPGTGESRKTSTRWLLLGALAALLIYAVTTLQPNVAASAGSSGLGSSSLRGATQVVLGGVLILGPVTSLLILEN